MFNLSWCASVTASRIVSSTRLLADSPYFDSFSMVCDVFYLGVRKIAGGSAKRSIEEDAVAENKKMRPTLVNILPANLVFTPSPSA